MSDNLRRFIRDTGWSFASLAISAAIVFILRIFLARYYGAADLGLYTLAFTVYSFGLIFSGFGIGAGLTKYVAEQRNNNNLLLTSGMISSFFTGGITGIVLFFASPLIANNFFHMPELESLLRIVAIAFPFIALEKATLGFLNGLRRMKLFAFINIIQYILTIIFTVTLALRGYSISSAVLSFVLPIILISLFSLLFIRKSLARVTLKQCVPAINILFVFGFYVVLANGLGAIQTYTDSTMLGYFMKATDVGIYGIATTLLQIVSMPPSSIQMITGPTTARYWAKGNIEGIENLINKCMKYTALVFIPIGLIVAFLSKDLIRLFFGVDFISATIPLQILVIGGVFSAIQTSVGSALSSTAYVKTVFMLTGITVVINIVLNLFLIPRFGLSGASIATAIASIVAVIVQNYFIRRLIGIKVDWKWFVKLFSFTILLIIVTLVLGRLFNYYIGLLIVLIVYIIISIKFFIKSDELLLIKSFLHR